MLNDKLQIESVDHIRITDVDSGEVLLDKRGSTLKLKGQTGPGKKSNNG